AGRSREEVVAAVRAAYDDRRPGTAAGMLYRFAAEIALGDWALMPESRTRSLFAGRVTGPYEHRPGERYPHVRAVAWTQRFGRVAPQVLQVATWPYVVLGALYGVLAIGLLLAGARRQADLERAMRSGEHRPLPFASVAVFTAGGVALALLTIVLVVAQA